MRYVTNMGELFAITEKNWPEFLRRIAVGRPVHDALPPRLAKSLGRVINVTDWEPVDAKMWREG